MKVKNKTTCVIRAIKVINKICKNDALIESKIKKEIDSLRDLNHPNIIKIFEIYHTERKAYIIEEYCQGGSLLEAFANNENKLDENIVKSIMSQVFSAVNFFHSKGIIHKNICPQYILNDVKKDDKYEIKIIDFSISEIASDSKKKRVLRI